MSSAFRGKLWWSSSPFCPNGDVRAATRVSYASEPICFGTTTSKIKSSMRDGPWSGFGDRFIQDREGRFTVATWSLCAPVLSGHGFNRWGGQQRDSARPSDTDELHDSGIGPAELEHNKGKPGSGGKYLWVYWTPVTCCIQVS